MAIMRWDPFKDLLSLQEKMNRMFDESLGKRSTDQEGLIDGAWRPPVDVLETEDSIILKAELPGVTRPDISVEVQDNMLILKGERHFERDTKEENFHRIERSYGKFFRSFSLPSEVDPEKVKASFKDGVLEVIVPKVGKAKAKQVEVNVE